MKTPTCQPQKLTQRWESIKSHFQNQLQRNWLLTTKKGQMVRLSIFMVLPTTKLRGLVENEGSFLNLLIISCFLFSEICCLQTMHMYLFEWYSLVTLLQFFVLTMQSPSLEKKKDFLEKTVPEPRASGSISVSFTPRVFKTAARESKAPEEEEVTHLYCQFNL